MRSKQKVALVLFIVGALIAFPVEAVVRSYRTQQAAVNELGKTNISARWRVLPPRHEVWSVMKLDLLDENGARLLSQLPHLECLLLPNSCTSPALRIVSELDGVEVLQLSNFHHLNDDDLKCLHSMKSLKHLHLYNGDFGDSAIEALRKARPDVTIEMRR